MALPVTAAMVTGGCSGAGCAATTPTHTENTSGNIRHVAKIRLRDLLDRKKPCIQTVYPSKNPVSTTAREIRRLQCRNANSHGLSCARNHKIGQKLKP